MASVAIGRCGECGRLQAEYEDAIAVRMQAEADFVAAVYSRNPHVIEARRQAAGTTIAVWKRAQARLNQHQTNHQFAKAAA